MDSFRQFSGKDNQCSTGINDGLKWFLQNFLALDLDAVEWYLPILFDAYGNIL